LFDIIFVASWRQTATFPRRGRPWAHPLGKGMWSG